MKRTRDPSHVLDHSSVYHDDDDDDTSTESGDFHLRKLRLEESDEDDDEALQPPPPKRKHFCVICRKQFRSGKAYGGHVRIHSSEYSNKGKKMEVKKMKKKKKKAKRTSGLVKREKEKETDLTRADVEGKIRCCVCGKEFRTKPSLFGHMSRHPDRSWKGIRPPPPPEKANLSFLDDGDDDDDDDDDDAMSDVTEEVQKAAYCLMMLSYEGKMKEKAMETPNSSSEVRSSNCYKDKAKRDGKGLIVNNPQVEAKRSLGFDLNQPYSYGN